MEGNLEVVVVTDFDKPIFMESRRGNQLILYLGYRYHMKDYKKPIETYPSSYKSKKQLWRCSTHNGRGCRATLYTYGNDIISANLEHNHEPVIDIGKQYYYARKSQFQMNIPQN